MDKKRLCVSAGVLLLTLLLPVVPIVFSSEQDCDLSANTKLDHVKIYSVSGNRWVQWDSGEAVKYSLDQVVTTIHYLFAAAAAGMAFVGKIVIEPSSTSSTARVLPRGVLWLLVAAVAFWLGSLTCGMVAHLYLAEIGTAKTFSIFGSLGINVLFQLLYFGTGMVMFLVALIYSID